MGLCFSIMFHHCVDIYYVIMHLELSIRPDIQIQMVNIYTDFLYYGKIWHYVGCPKSNLKMVMKL